jgi:FkbM family methyltransferase
MNLFKKYKNIPFKSIIVDECNYVININDNVISKSLDDGNYWEPYMHFYFDKYITPNTLVLDIGANIGTHSIVMAKANPTVQIHSFEPMDIHYDLLVVNKNMNNLNNLHCYNVGLGESESIMYQPKLEFDKEGNFGGHGLTYEQTEKEIIIKTIDQYNLTNVSFIKCDVEGFELNVIKGGIQTIMRNKPTMIIEVWDTQKEMFFNDNTILQLLNIYKYEIISHMHGIADYLFTLKI